MPERLIIPKLSIHALVHPVGIRADGTMGVPSNFTDVAWYKYGPAPGEKGSAVIDGHVDNALALPGVFKHLSELAPGDDVYVETASSTEVHFIVTDVETRQRDIVLFARFCLSPKRMEAADYPSR